jgi:tRNA pseudouridine55 synthase
MTAAPEGILLVDKPAGRSSFSVVAQVRRLTGQKKIGHVGTLDPFATGLLIFLLGRVWTKKAGLFLESDKEYEATVRLGRATDSYDCDGKTTFESALVPSEQALASALSFFQGPYEQTPPMFSAKKQQGTRLYTLARKGIEVERKKIEVSIETTLLSYTYPDVSLLITGSRGTYVRSIAHDLGERLGCYAHVHKLNRTRSGPFFLKNALSLEQIASLQVEQLQRVMHENVF